MHTLCIISFVVLVSDIGITCDVLPSSSIAVRVGYVETLHEKDGMQ